MRGAFEGHRVIRVQLFDEPRNSALNSSSTPTERDHDSRIPLYRGLCPTGSERDLQHRARTVEAFVRDIQAGDRHVASVARERTQPPPVLWNPGRGQYPLSVVLDPRTEACVEQAVLSGFEEALILNLAFAAIYAIVTALNAFIIGDEDGPEESLTDLASNVLNVGFILLVADSAAFWGTMLMSDGATWTPGRALFAGATVFALFFTPMADLFVKVLKHGDEKRNSTSSSGERETAKTKMSNWLRRNAARLDALLGKQFTLYRIISAVLGVYLSWELIHGADLWTSS